MTIRYLSLPVDGGLMKTLYMVIKFSLREAVLFLHLLFLLLLMVMINRLFLPNHRRFLFTMVNKQLFL